MCRGAAWLLAAATAFALRGVQGDVYLHNPRGSNNKLSEQSNNRANANRLFDSQNNGKAGYQIGDNCKPVCHQGENNNQYDETKEGAMKGQMYYYQGSDLYIEWTEQHGCGLGNPNVICQLILQYMCESDNPEIRDGTKRGNQNTAGGQSEPPSASASREKALGQHEPLDYYLKCRKRQRNRGLYKADKHLNNNVGATATRQNPGGNNNANQRHGLECPEERDYYPYWHPTPWHDIAIFTDEPETRCGYYRNMSENVRAKGECSEPQFNNPKSCAKGGGHWKESWPRGEPPPVCVAGVESRDNHHGNTRGDQPRYYIWRIPYHVEGQCVLRLRYNVTTGDFHPQSVANKGGVKKGGRDIGKDYFFIDHKHNKDPILRQDPQSDYLGLGEEFKLQLQVNTNQYGRTFEDRTHTFKVVKRPLTHMLEGNPRIVNYNVRGRRGNIVQVYPSVEYDFVPTELTVEQGTYLHVQWTGSDANQLNNAGNGRAGTDRSNLVQLSSRQENVPIPGSEHTLLSAGTGGWGGDLLKKFSYLGQADIVACNKNDNNEQSTKNCKQLNGASGYFDGGLVKLTQIGTHHVMSTRNNDFSNRSQKATIWVLHPRLRTWQIELAAIFGAAFLCFGIYLGAAYYAYHRPQSWLFSKKHRPRILRYLCWPEEIERKEQERRAYMEEERRLLLGGSHSNLELSSRDERRAQGPSLDVVGATHDLSIPWEKYGRPGKERCLRCLACCGLGEGQQLFVVAYLLLNALLYAAGFLAHHGKGFRQSIAYPMAKGGGYVLDLNLAMIVLPTLKGLQTALHGKGGLAREWIPLDDPIKFHRTIGFVAGIGTLVHIAGHVLHMHTIATSPPLQADVLNVYNLEPDEVVSGTPISKQFHSYKMVTGVLLTLGFLAIFATAPGCIRRRGWGFRLFQRTHGLWPALYLVLLLHGNQRTWVWLFFPALFIAVDRLSQMQAQQHPAVLLSARLLPKDVVHLTLDPPEGFSYQAGQYVMLNWANEWHPFTLTSAPEESIISVHIRSPPTLDWCHALRRRLITEAPAQVAGDEVVGRSTPEPEPGKVVEYTRLELPGGITCCRPSRQGAGARQMARGVTESLEKSLEARVNEAGAVMMRLAGPFGAPAQRVWEFGPIMVVGAGIGVTPFVSIMRSVQLRAQQRAALLGAAKVDSSASSSSIFRRSLRQRKKDAQLEAAANTSTGMAGAAISWAKKRAGGKAGASEAAASETAGSASGSKAHGPKAGEDWNPEALAELVFDVVPIPTKIHFYWIVRTQEELDWFYDLLAAAVEGSAKDIAEVNLFTTGEVSAEGVKKLSCASTQHFGRPNWGPIFKSVKDQHQGENIGVFLCGNPAIGEELAVQSREHSDPPEAGQDRTRFSFFKEHF